MNSPAPHRIAKMVYLLITTTPVAKLKAWNYHVVISCSVQTVECRACVEALTILSDPSKLRSVSKHEGFTTPLGVPGKPTFGKSRLMLLWIHYGN